MFVRIAASAVALTAGAGGASADLAGHVLDIATGEPVAAARVTVRGGETTTTDAAGAFMVSANDGDAVTLVAAHAGHFNAWLEVVAPQAELVVEVERVPLDDDPTYTFASPQTCASCHPEQYADWRDSPMANAGINTWVYDLYDGTGTAGGMGGFVYTRDSMLASDNPASECASCHQPLGWAAAPYGAMSAIDSPAPETIHGVSCDLCHRLAAIDVSRPNFPGIWPGIVRLARRDAETPVQFGVLGDTAFESGLMRPAYQPQLTADLCAACHQDKNDPDGDGDFEEANGVISEPTYLEWKASRYADPTDPAYASCVDCHMGPRDDLTSACSVQELEPRPPGQVRSHRIEGSTAAYLEHAVTVTVTGAVGDGDLGVDVEIVNDQTGHHVPTGVTVRNMVLRVEAFGPDGEPLEATGGDLIGALGGVGDPAQGYWAGLPGKIYAKVPADAAGLAPVFYTEAASLAADNRLAAGARDATHHTFALPTMAGPVHVVARLVYRRAFRAVVDAKGWTTDGHGEPLADLVAPDFGHRMARVETSVTVEPGDLISEASGCCQTGARGAGHAALALGVLLGLTWRRVRRRPTG